MFSITPKPPALDVIDASHLAFLSHIPFSCNKRPVLTCISPRSVSLFSTSPNNRTMLRQASFSPTSVPLTARASPLNFRPEAVHSIPSPRDTVSVPTPPSTKPSKPVPTKKPETTPSKDQTKQKKVVEQADKKKSIGQSISDRFKLHRLSSKEDSKWIHKSTSAVFCLSSLIIMGYMPFRQIFFHDAALPPPELLDPLLLAWVPSATIQAVSGAQMAVKFRKNDTNSRDMFLNNSFMTMINVWVVLKLCIDLPAPFDSDLLSQVISGGLTTLVTVMSFRSIAAAPDLLKTRCKRSIKNVKPREEDSADKKWSVSDFVDYVNYIFPIFYPLPFMVGTFLFFVFHDSDWIRTQCEMYPNIEAIGLYLNVGAAFTIGIISLLVTIRDRKMINKKVESLGISAISIALTAWLFWSLQSLIGFDALHILRPECLM